jgi:hypothetical protein
LIARRAVAISVLSGLIMASAPLGWGVQKAPPPKSQARAPQPKTNGGPNAGNAQRKAQNQSQGQRPGGDLALQKLAQMSPADRQKALANLPPARRAEVLKQLQTYQSMSPQARARANQQLQRLQSLPPKRQNQVRGSLQKFQKLPEDRRTAVGAELDRLGAMPEEQRAARMNSPEFKSQYSASERQMMGDISLVLPQQTAAPAK